MCFSAEVWDAYKKYQETWFAELSIKEFAKLYKQRKEGGKVKITKSMDAAFAKPKSEEGFAILKMINEFNAEQIVKFEQEEIKQAKRLEEAEQKLLTKTTKAATENKRIAIDKIGAAERALDDLRRKEPKSRDGRIFPAYFAPVMVVEDGKRVIKPMRYQCRPAGKPSFYDVEYPGTYNARRDNLERFWRGQFGYTHGIMIVNAFYENVSKHAMEGRELEPNEKEENVRLEFRPIPEQDMLVACLWSHWKGKGEPDLLSFAAITDEPPAEVAAAGHDRCIIPIKPENVDAWLNPDPNNLAALYAILDDRARPYYEHRMAA